MARGLDRRHHRRHLRLSRWRFRGIASYFEKDHHARAVRAVEWVAVAVCAVWLCWWWLGNGSGWETFSTSITSNCRDRVSPVN